MPEGQSLRWWQEEEAAAKRPAVNLPQIAAAPPAVAEETVTEFRDIGEELEAEAARRAEEARRNEENSLVFQTVPRRMMRAAVVNGTVNVLLYGTWALLSLSDGHRNVLASTLYGLLSLMCLCQAVLRIQGARQSRPVLALRQDSLSVDLALQPDGSGHSVGLTAIPWRHIASIRAVPRGRFGKGYDLIELRDTEAFAQTLRPAPARLMRRLKLGRGLSQEVRWTPWRPAPPPTVRISGALLPLDARAIAARIAAYETGRA